MPRVAITRIQTQKVALQGQQLYQKIKMLDELPELPQGPTMRERVLKLEDANKFLQDELVNLVVIPPSHHQSPLPPLPPTHANDA